MIKDGTFSPDLYYRFETELVIPPLRERYEDIPKLVKHFILNEQKNAQTPMPDWYEERHTELLAQALLRSNYYWPGNVRQLRNIVGEIFESCIRNSAEENFEQDVSNIINARFAKSPQNASGELSNLLSDLVFQHLDGYKDGEPPLRNIIDKILVQAVGVGLDTAFVKGRFKPASQKEVGKALEIQSLVNENRALLPLERDGKDYILATLRSLRPDEDYYPEVFNQVLQKC